jgi:hypothetical protein
MPAVSLVRPHILVVVCLGSLIPLVSDVGHRRPEALTGGPWDHLRSLGQCACTVQFDIQSDLLRKVQYANI